MKKRVPDKFWFPWWPDKWIFGSVRIECTPAERGIWVDLLSLASKDDGHIRANEETPYPLQQLAGMLIIPENDLKSAIDKFIKSKKLIKNKNGTLYIIKWDKYQFSERHKRRIESEMSEKTATVSEDKDAILYNSINDNKIDKRIAQSQTEFELFYTNYPRHIAKKDAELAFNALRKKVDFRTIEKATMGYIAFLKQKHVNENFEQSPMYPASFLRKEKWKDYVDFSYKPPL